MNVETIPESNLQEFKESFEFRRVLDFYNEIEKDIEFFLHNEENLSFSISYKQLMTKLFVISAANSFETYFINNLAYALGAKEKSSQYEFIQSKALERKYHSLFDWERKNANYFFSSFGEKFKLYIECYRKKDNSFKEGEMSFLSLGQDRNFIVHKGVVTYSFETDLSVVKQKYDQSLYFCEKFFVLLKNFNNLSVIK